jgi:hypothetical protein
LEADLTEQEWLSAVASEADEMASMEGYTGGEADLKDLAMNLLGLGSITRDDTIAQAAVVVAQHVSQP